MTATIIQAIHQHIQRQGGSPSDWYVGITGNVQSRLFGDHNVARQNAWWIFRDCGTSAAARAVEKAFLDWGCRGGGGGGDQSAKFVYAYLISTVTVE